MGLVSKRRNRVRKTVGTVKEDAVCFASEDFDYGKVVVSIAIASSVTETWHLI